MIPHQLESIQYHYKNLLHYHQKSTWPLLLCCTKLPTSGESSQPNNHLQSNCPSLLTCHDAYHTFANLSPIYSTSVLASRPAPLLAKSFTQSTWPSLASVDGLDMMLLISNIEDEGDNDHSWQLWQEEGWSLLMLMCATLQQSGSSCCCLWSQRWWWGWRWR